MTTIFSTYEKSKNPEATMLVKLIATRIKFAQQLQ